MSVGSLTSGAPAPTSEPLTLMQRKLVLEEEFAAWVDVDETFGHRSLERLPEWLSEHPDLVEQLLPTHIPFRLVEILK